MSRPWILLCPSTRGIGHALARHLLTTTTLPILATARSPADTHDALKAALLKDLPPSASHSKNQAADRLQIVHLDVTDESTIHSAATHASTLFPRDTYHLHLAFALPGILRNPEKSPAQIDYDAALETYKVNALGPLLLMKHFSPFLPRKATEIQPFDNDEGLPAHAVWTTMSARVGSISDNKLGGWYSYRSSKAAVNSLTKSLDVQLRSRSGDKAMAIAYHPGTVKTDLSRDFWGSVANDSLFDVDDAAGRMAGVVLGAGLDMRGRVWDYKGDEVLP
ncbi:hypothetical protein B0T19DRAFT_15279 [Cercophora scortea]|uniref:Short-chain dehydrogenase/reductase n=1 Tax=Cercophora scortea TaxID=314031 RepID=A0AAE0MKN7_9PEZI|nr:hypothetical protein B0T19DRAFT_15279 [Cercophora scortea]